MELSDFFQSTVTDAGTHSWSLVSHDPTSAPTEALARTLSTKIMEQLCRGCPQHFQAWQAGLDDGSELVGASEATIKAFVNIAFGLPNTPKPDDHVEGYVAEQLWYFLSLEVSTDEEIVRVEPPGFASTDPGGDGLIIHRLQQGELMFRLWEIKKCAGNSNVSRTVGNAYDQLQSNAIEYLARYTAIGQELPDDDGELADFYGRLTELWIEGHPGAAAGVSVATSSDSVPRRCFSTFGNRFPQFTSPARLRGMLAAIDDFSEFASTVRDYVWTGL